MNLLVRARIETRRELARQGFGPLYERIQQIMLSYNPAGFDLTKGTRATTTARPWGR